MKNETNSRVPTSLIFQMVGVLLLALASLSNLPISRSSGFTALYAFACFAAAFGWYGARADMAPRMKKLLGGALGGALTLALPAILVLVSAAHMFVRSTQP